MIHTNVLKLEPPYQIIAAGWHVGIQTATLIVTEDRTKETGHYSVVSHSHPIVSYGLKDFTMMSDELVQRIKTGRSDMCFRPEGAVWEKVEIRDVLCLGLAGVTKEISFENFLDLFFNMEMEGVEATIQSWKQMRLFFRKVETFCHDIEAIGITVGRPVKVDVKLVHEQNWDNLPVIDCSVIVNGTLIRCVDGSQPELVEGFIEEVNRIFKLRMKAEKITEIVDEMKKIIESRKENRYD